MLKNGENFENAFISFFNRNPLIEVLPFKLWGFNKKYLDFQNNLNYAVCIRRNSDTCTVTYSNEVDDTEYDFQIINVDSGDRALLLIILKKKLFYAWLKFQMVQVSYHHGKRA